MHGSLGLFVSLLFLLSLLSLLSLLFLRSNTGTKAVLDRLLRLNVLMTLREEAADWTGLFTADHVDSVLTAIEALLDELRPDVVALTDAFGYDDYMLKVRSSSGVCALPHPVLCSDDFHLCILCSLTMINLIKVLSVHPHNPTYLLFLDMYHVRVITCVLIHRSSFITHPPSLRSAVRTVTCTRRYTRTRRRITLLTRVTLWLAGTR